MSKRTLTASEKAFDLLARLVKHTEPGGSFYWDGQPSDAVREDFLAEAEGLLMSRGNAAGETPPEILVVALQLALRDIRATLAAANMRVLPLVLEVNSLFQSLGGASDRASEVILRLSQGMDACTAAIAKAGATCDQCLHSTGVPRDKAMTAPSTKEVDEAFNQFGGSWCNCEKCRRDRAGDALAKLRKEGGAKSR